MPLIPAVPLADPAIIRFSLLQFCDGGARSQSLPSP